MTLVGASPSADLVHIRLAKSAALVANCETAILLRNAAGGVGETQCMGAPVALGPLVTGWLQGQLAKLSPDDGPFEARAANEPILQCIACASGRAVEALIAIPAFDQDDAIQGALVLLGDGLAPRISPAQRYVLTTHALHLGELLRQDALRGSPAAEDVRGQRLRLLESVVINANDAILITEAEPIDPPGPRIVYCNASFTRTTGYSEAEIIGKTPRILQADAVDRTVLDRLRRALERWEPVEVELLNTRKDGTEFWVELSIVPVADDRGWFTHWVSVQRDISQRKIAEDVAIRARVAEIENKALATEIRERKNVEEQLLYAAYHDDLTRLRNRAYFMDRLTTLLGTREVPRTGAGTDAGACPWSVLFLDLDRFKLINDSLGHRAGDLLLIEVARRLQACIRPQDTLARVGGDEFAVLVENHDDAVQNASKMAQRLLKALDGPITLGRSEVFTSCSIGVVNNSGHYNKAEDVLRDADIAMYKSKKEGMSGFAVYNAEMHADIAEALTLQTDLRHALARSEFILFYQPIYSTTSGRIIGLEALVRWNHPMRGLVPPSSFIPVAEEIGLIRELDCWVLRQACLQMREWLLHFPDLEARLSVNVSADELRDPGFLDELRAVLCQTNLEGYRLQLEITEGVFLREPGLIAQVLSEIRALGVRVALDDFGTGYSSLGYLDRYEIDTLKIDRNFVARMLRQDRAMAIMDGIVRLGTALKLDIVAEGVELESQLVALRAMGCHSVQGYLLGRPSSVQDISALLRAQNNRNHLDSVPAHL